MAEYVVVALLRVSLISAVMIGVVLLVRAIAESRIKSGLISALWLMVLLRLLLPVTIGVPFSINTWLDGVLPKSSVAAAVETSETAETAENPLAFEETDILPATATETIDAGLVTVEKTEPEWVTFFKAHTYHGLLAIWLLGVGLFFAVTGHRMRRFKKHVLKGRFLDIQWLNATVFSYKHWLGVRREIRVMESNLVDVPVVMGVFRPIIILPKGLVATLDREKIKVILLHEICHIKRRDLTKNALWLAAKGVYWFNPLVWVAYKVYLDDAEQACDAMVVGAVNEAGVVVYSEALVAVMRQAKICTVVPAFVSFCKNSSSLRKRVTNMLNPKKKPVAVSALVMILMLVMAVGCFTTACMKGTEGNIPTDTALDAVQVTASDLNEDTSVDFKEGLTMQAVSSAPQIEVEAENLTIEQLNTVIDELATGASVYTQEGQTFDGSEASANALMQAFDDDQILEVFAEGDDGIEQRFELMQTPDGLRTQLVAFSSGGGKNGDDVSGEDWTGFTLYEGQDIADMENSFAECLAMAETFVKELDGQDSNFIFDFAYICEGAKPAYRIFFKRAYDGVSINPVSRVAYKNSSSPTNDQKLNNEVLCIFVGDDGIFEMYWHSNYSKFSVADENSPLMDTDSIMKIFVNASKDIRLGGNQNIVPNITINQIDLNYMIVNEENENGKYAVIPVWDFIGDVSHEGIPEGGSTLEHQDNVCVMTINAIDGEIIDR